MRAMTALAMLAGPVAAAALLGAAEPTPPAQQETLDSPIQLTSHAAEDRSPSWSPDGERLLFASDRDGDSEIYIVERGGGGLRRLTEHPASDRSPAFSPDGRRFVFESDREGPNGLWIQELSGGEATLLFSDPSPELVPDWSPDGEWIAFTSERDGDPELYRIALESGAVERLTVSEQRDLWPRYSPGGDRLAFFSRRATEGRFDDLFVLELGSGSVSAVTAHPTHHDFVPDFSPDGEHLVAGMSDRAAGVRELVIHHLTEGVVHRFAGGYHRVFQPAWSPDGRWIAYAARTADGRAADIYLVRAVD